MKVSLNWVEEYVKLTIKPGDLKERMSVSLTEVESIEDFGRKFDRIVVAEVVNIKAHPGSDKLLLLILNTGNKTVTVIVQRCPVKAGDKVAYLPVGTVVPSSVDDGSNLIVEKREMHGVTSDGMVASGRELGLNYDHTTVYTVDPSTKPGTPLSKVLDLEDQIIEIQNKSLSHRPDAFSIIGIAREIAALQGTEASLPDWYTEPDKFKPGGFAGKGLDLEVVNEVKSLCPRYMAIALDDVKVAPSPLWLQVKLAKIGIHPVNNVVDISNYLMAETGQPSHAFDYDKVVSKDRKSSGGAMIKVRLARGGEKITTLDGQQRELYEDTMIISDSTSPIGIAGVMGGKDTEISEGTKRVIFQVENLDMYSVRRTSMKVGVMSDAVNRFTRGLDPNLCASVMYRGVELMRELAGARIASKLVDLYEDPVKEKSVTFDPDMARGMIGAGISDAEMTAILTGLGLTVKNDSKSKAMVVTVPTFRRDISIPEDVVEEIIRVYGYDRIKPQLPSREMTAVAENLSYKYRKTAKSTLKALGGNELYLYSFVGKSLYDKCSLSLEKAYKIKNALSPELEYMKPLLFPSLLDKAEFNLNYRSEQLLFEVDMIDPCKDWAEIEKSLPAEPWHLGFVSTVSYYKAKAALEAVLASLYVSDFSVIPSGKTSQEIPGWIKYAQNSMHPIKSGYVRIDGRIVGLIGCLSPQTIKAYDLPDETGVVELDFDALLQFCNEVPKYKPVSAYPHVAQDFCFVLDRDVPYDAVISAIEKVDKESEIAGLECKDIYQSDADKEHKKVTLSITMQRPDRVMTEKDISRVRKALIESVGRETGGRLAE